VDVRSVAWVNEPPPNLEVNVPEDLKPGVYANGAMVWHTPYEFTLDFFATQPRPPDSSSVPCHVTARVKIPPTVVFELLRALNDNMTKYEAQFGEIRRVRPVDRGGGGGGEAER
jgi:Protein of unknown function (DUF3467)